MSDADFIFAFVLMPFASEFDDVYRLGIKEPASALGIRAERVDEQIYAEGILDRIYRQIDAADFIIADMSGQNANVFYEVGYAHAKDKLCLLLTKDAADIPFDLKHKRHIVYGDSIHGLRQQLTNDFQWAKSEIDNIRRSRIRVQPKSISGDLEKTKWRATAKVTFLLDLHNDSDVPSAEIETIYFYTGHDWIVHQDNRRCPSTESDLPQYKHRHFLTTPVKRLQRACWAQLRFVAERTVATAFRGEELKDSYPITGHSICRLVTDKGMFDYEISIDIVAESFPF
jgi:nucleoside 2-deoxyribosyltransferase